MSWTQHCAKWSKSQEGDKTDPNSLAVNIMERKKNKKKIMESEDQPNSCIEQE